LSESGCGDREGDGDFEEIIRGMSQFVKRQHRMHMILNFFDGRLRILRTICQIIHSKVQADCLLQQLSPEKTCNT